MTRYLVALGVIALAVGALFRGAATFHLPLLKMAGTIGILLFGVFGTAALQRFQVTSGRKEVEAGLLGLGEGYIITDWSEGSGPPAAPDYVVAAPAGIAAVCVDAMPNTGGGRRVEARIARSRQRAQQAARWVAEHLPRPEKPAEPVPVMPILVLTRYRAPAGQTQAPEAQTAAWAEDTVLPVVNPEQLGRTVQRLAAPDRLPLEERYRLTRILRRTAPGARK